MIYTLLRRKIRLSNNQNLFLINLAVGDILVSTSGVFRGLGIINSKFVGVDDNNSTTLFAGVITVFMYAVSAAGILALIPLTLDRTMAVALPLHHRSLVTKKTCFLMCAVFWVPTLVTSIYFTSAYFSGSTNIKYLHMYHRCIMLGTQRTVYMVCLFVFPFFLILLLYLTMLFIIITTRRPCRRFLITALCIILANLVTYSPSTISYIWDTHTSYEVTQILNVTIFYTNGVINPVVYLATHPATKRYLRNRSFCGVFCGNIETTEPSAIVYFRNPQVNTST